MSFTIEKVFIERADGIKYFTLDKLLAKTSKTDFFNNSIRYVGLTKNKNNRHSDKEGIITHVPVKWHPNMFLKKPRLKNNNKYYSSFENMVNEFTLLASIHIAFDALINNYLRDITMEARILSDEHEENGFPSYLPIKDDWPTTSYQLYSRIYYIIEGSGNPTIFKS